jgi:WD40 repeat protein
MLDTRRDAVVRLAPLRHSQLPPLTAASGLLLPVGPTPAPTTIRGSLPAGSQGATTLAYSPDASLLAIACLGASQGCPSQHAIRVYDASQGTEVCTPLQGHSGLINSLDWSPDGLFLLSASSDGTALVWFLPRHPRHAYALAAHPGTPHARLSHPQLSYVYSARFHPSLSCLVLTAAYDGALRLWDALLDEQVAGRQLAVGASSSSSSSSSEAEVVCLEARCKGCLVGPSGGEEGYVNCLEWDGVGLGEGLGPRQLVTGDSRGVLRFYACAPLEAAHRPERYVLQKEAAPSALRGGAIVALRARPPAPHRLEASHLLVLSQASRLLLYDGFTYAQLRAFPTPVCSSKRLEACFSPDGAWVAAGSEAGALCLWDAETGAALPAMAAVAGVDEGGRVVPGSGRASIGYPGVLLGVAWSTSGLAICGFGAEYNAMVVA